MKIVNNNQFAAFVPYVLIIDRPERVSVYNHSITCLQGIEELLFFPDDLYLKTTFYQILLNSFRYEARSEERRVGKEGRYRCFVATEKEKVETNQTERQIGRFI